MLFLCCSIQNTFIGLNEKQGLTQTHTQMPPHNFNVHFHNALKAFYHTYLMLFFYDQ